jgi:hypothetical protein
VAKAYELRLRPAALDNLKTAREEVRRQIGSTQVGATLESLTPTEAGDLANALLTLLDGVDSVITRAKLVD